MADLKALAAPFPPNAVSWRIGSTNNEKTRGMALAYLDARDVMERLDEACGPDGWQATYPHAGQKTVCSIGILCGEHWVWKSNGAGDSDIEAEKGALSDAFKRAAVLWGVGRYLYNIASPWVEIETRGRTSVIKDAEYKKLAEILRRATAGEKVPAEPQPQSAPPPPVVAPGPSSANGRRMAAAEPQLIDTTRTKGTLPAAGATKAEERAARVKAGVDKRVSILGSVKVWIRPALDQFWTDNAEWIEWMADPKNEVIPEYERFLAAWNVADKNARTVELA